jgi:hypothetical protein
MAYEPEPKHITMLGMTLGVNTMSDARDIIGPAVVTMGEYRHEPYSMCCKSADPADATVLTIQTDYFGDWERLTRFEISSSGQSGNCAASALVSLGIATQSGLRLGMSRPEVEAIMGKPGVVRGDISKYMYIVEKELTSEKRERVEEFGIVTVDYDVVTTIIEAEFSDGRLIRLRISWTESV